GIIHATEKGIIISKKDTSYIFPILIDSIAHIEISQDNLKAYIYIVPPGPHGKEITSQQVDQLLKEKSITYGIKHNMINKLTQNANRTGTKKEKRIIAEGKKQINGKNTMLNYLVDISFSKIPSITFDERADYFDIHTFESVTKGQHIAQILPLTKGIDGKDIFGNIIPALPGEKMKLTLGKNVSVSDGDAYMITADVDGHVYLDKNILFVEEILVIDSNIDFNTGNIDFKGDIVIKGDVQSGFSVNSGGSVYIGGMVDDAKISAGGNVVIKGGFVGHGKGKIKADKDVIVKNVLNQTIIAKNNIFVESESVEANLYAGNSIRIENHKSWCIGGSVVACKSMNIYNIGNELNNKTNIYCGISHFVEKILDELKMDINTLKHEIYRLNKRKKQLLTNTELQSKANKKMEDALEEKLVEIKEELKSKKMQYDKNEKYLQAVFNDNNGEISVLGTIYPDVKIRLGNNTYLTNEELKRCTFYSKENKFYIRHLHKNREEEIVTTV
ncbi:MAG: FapA family protein, partial [Chitinispirillia bacterium]